ncbi:protein of unknown function [Legionella hackeliae]|uniref:Uncharacterized protein n=1 Tax=Legionella hackeliae TaxID=449 RepID=A0A0A8UVY6_LEGHA|nr:protein of unknown function [Legionella hackeliae]
MMVSSYLNLEGYNRVLGQLRLINSGILLVDGGYGWTRTTDLSIMSAAL